MIPVELNNTMLVSMGSDYVILLRSPVDSRALPISIGQLEAQSIAIKLNGIAFPRPLTHDLFKNTLESLGCTLQRVEICDLIDNTFYARLIVGRGSQTLAIDARPSDSIALALRFGAPVFVEEKVMDLAGIQIDREEGQEPAPDGEMQEKKRLAGTEADLESLQEQLKLAVKAERYEDAARLRDQINKKTKHN